MVSMGLGGFVAAEERSAVESSLAAIKEHPALRRIPVVVITTSKAEEDVLRTYDLGVSSFISKPGSYESLLALIRTLSNYWFRTVRLPGHAPVK